MRTLGRITIAIAMLACASVVLTVKAEATPILLTTRPATGDIIDWAQFGPPQTQFNTSHDFVSTGGHTGTLILSPNQMGITQEQCCIGVSGLWDGNFTPGDIVADTQNIVGTTMTLAFHTPVRTAGAQIQWNSLGDFTAEIEAFSGNHLLASFTEAGQGNYSSANGSAIFLGVTDDVPEITSIVFEMVCPGGSNPGCYGFGIDEVSISGVPVPEPSSLAVLLFALIGVWFCAKRPKRAQPQLP